jgi:hypothetical protein
MERIAEHHEPDTLHEHEPRSKEEQQILLWRFAQGRRLGLSHVEARLFAESDADLGLFRCLVARGCTAELALRITL